MIQTNTDNDDLFRSARHRLEMQQPTTGPSSWLTAPRDGWTQQQDAKRTQLSNSKVGRQISAGIIIGHIRTAGRR